MIKIYKTREVKTPTRGTDFSAGIDFYIPKIDNNFMQDFMSKNIDNLNYVCISYGEIILTPLSRVLIPAGIKIKIPEGNCLIMFNKSGVSSKLGLDVLACVIDEDYQGECHISLFNSNSYNNVTLTSGQKIVQGIILPIRYDEIETVNYISDLYSDKSVRGEGGFGSTDKKGD